jgi:hypothetical protein
MHQSRREPPGGDAVAQQLERRLTELHDEVQAVLTGLRLRRLEADQASGELAGRAGEVLGDLYRAHGDLSKVLPALVTASTQFEDGDGLLTEPVRVVSEVIGRLEGAAGVLLIE